MESWSVGIIQPYLWHRIRFGRIVVKLVSNLVEMFVCILLIERILRNKTQSQLKWRMTDSSLDTDKQRWIFVIWSICWKQWLQSLLSDKQETHNFEWKKRDGTYDLTRYWIHPTRKKIESAATSAQVSKCLSTFSV